jgi:hypothetical protein
VITDVSIVRNTEINTDLTVNVTDEVQQALVELFKDSWTADDFTYPQMATFHKRCEEWARERRHESVALFEILKSTVLSPKVLFMLLAPPIPRPAFHQQHILFRCLIQGQVVICHADERLLIPNGVINLLKAARSSTGKLPFDDPESLLLCVLSATFRQWDEELFDHIPRMVQYVRGDGQWSDKPELLQRIAQFWQTKLFQFYSHTTFDGLPKCMTIATFQNYDPVSDILSPFQDMLPEAKFNEIRDQWIRATQKLKQKWWLGDMLPP